MFSFRIIYLSRDGEASIAGICLVQAVRSFLHFSQLSAWLNKSSGSRPQQLLYRVTMPGQAFASKFVSKPVDHHFPLAHVGRLATHAIKVRFSHYFFGFSLGIWINHNYFSLVGLGFRQFASSDGCNSTCSLWQVSLYHAQAECGCGPATVATKAGQQQLSRGRSPGSASSSVTLTAPTAFPIAIQFAFVTIRQATCSSDDTQGPTAATL